jgi:DNA-directed RNA polymerase specialized sigma24 family protein
MMAMPRKLTWAAARKARSRRAEGWSIAKIAACFGIDYKTCRSLLLGETYRTETVRHFRRLTDEQAAEARRLHALDGITQRALAEKFGVCRRTISQLLNNKTAAYRTG